MNVLRVVFLGLATLVTVLCALFIVRYHEKSEGDWRQTETGKHLMSMSVAIGLVCGVWAIGIVLSMLGNRDLPMWFHILRVVAFTTIPAMLVWRLSILERAYPADLVVEDAEDDKDAHA